MKDYEVQYSATFKATGRRTVPAESEDAASLLAQTMVENEGAFDDAGEWEVEITDIVENPFS